MTLITKILMVFGTMFFSTMASTASEPSSLETELSQEAAKAKQEGQTTGAALKKKIDELVKEENERAAKEAVEQNTTETPALVE